MSSAALKATIEVSDLDSLKRQIKERKLDLLRKEHYLEPRWLPDGRWAAIMIFMFTTAIIVGVESDIKFGYEDRWCYHNYEDALKALNEWDGTDEPKGWHRHPSSGRRVNENGEEHVCL